MYNLPLGNGTSGYIWYSVSLNLLFLGYVVVIVEGASSCAKGNVRFYNNHPGNTFMNWS